MSSLRWLGFAFLILAGSFVLPLATSATAWAQNPAACPGGPFDPPNNGGSNNYNCAVSGNSGSITNVQLQTNVSYAFPSACSPEHTWRLFSPLGTEFLIGTRNGNQTITTISTFNGEGANGTWTLRETDSNGNDACNGNVSGWTLTFTLSGGPVNPSATFIDSVLGENGAPSVRVQIDTDDGQPTTVAGSVDIVIDTENPGSATLGSDYTQTVTTLSVPIGTADGATFNVVGIIDDAALERAETIGLMFDNPSNINAADTRFQVTINDDETGVVVFSAAGSASGEFGSPLHAMPMEVQISSNDGTPSLGLFLFGTIARISGSATQGTFNAICPNQDWSFFNDPVTFNDSDEFYLNSSTPTYSPRIRVCDDGLGDSGETIVMRATLNSPPSNVTVGADHTVTITESTAVAVADASASESNATLQFTISLSAPAPAGGVDIDWQTAAGGGNPATAGVDYTAASGTATIAQGANSTTVDIGLLNDTAVEGDETFLLQLTGVSDAGFVITDDEAIGTVLNDDTEFRVFLSDPDFSSTFEGSGGGTTPFTLRVVRDGLRTSAQSVQIQTVAGSAQGGGVDFADVPLTTLNFAPSQVFAEVIVQVTADDIDENDEDFSAPLSNATGGAGISPTQGTANVTILDDDNPTISIGDVLVNEADGQAVFDVTLSGATTFAVSVQFGTSGNGAVAPDDFTTVSGTLDFVGNDGEVQTVSVPIIDDDLQESSEGFRVFLHTPVNVTIVDGQGDGTIEDNDVPVLSIADVSVSEDGNVLAFVVSTGVRVQNAVTVFYDTADGAGPDAAVAPDDYTAIVNGSVVVPQGSSQGTINVLVQNDTEVEANETMSVTLSGSSPVLVIDDAIAVGTILDDDEPQVSAEDAVAVEGSTALVFTISASRAALAGGIDVQYETALGGAVPASASDFVATSGTAVIPFGQDSVEVPVSLVDDSVVEPDETLLLQITGISGDAQLDDGEGVGQIIDDDAASLAIDGVHAPEGDSGNTPFAFMLTLSGEVQDGFSLPFVTASASAQAGSDFQTALGLLEFDGTDGEVRSVVVQVHGDNQVEPDERFLLNLGEPPLPGIGLVASSAEGVIADDDEFPDRIFANDFDPVP